MKKKVNPIIIVILVLVIILGIMIYMYVAPSGSNQEEITTQSDTEETSDTVEVSSSIQTIENTLSSSGQISSALSEKLYLYASKYFESLLVEENTYIASGTNIVQYTDGTYLTAPYDLVVTSENLPNKDEICTTSHYVEIQSIETLSMSLSVSESDINKVEIGDIVDITITATNEKLEGNITSISEVGSYNSSGSTFPATVTFENPGNLKIGMSASCEIIIERAENVVAVPIEAVQTSDEGKYVVVVNSDGTTENVTVETGISNDAYIEIKSGITENTTVQMEESTSSSSGMGGNFRNRGSSSGDMNFSGGSPAGDFPSGGSMEKPSGGMMP